MSRKSNIEYYGQVPPPTFSESDDKQSSEQSSTPEEARLESQSCNTTVESSEHDGPFPYWPNQAQKRMVHLNQFSLLFHTNRAVDEEIFNDPTESRLQQEYHSSCASIEHGEDYTVQTYYVM